MAEVWVTGARGFIGRHVARLLSTRGHRVSAVGYGAWLEQDRSEWGVSVWANSAVTSAGLDVLANETAAKPDIILHLAGGSSVSASVIAPREDHARTVTASAEIAEWVRTRSPESRVVFASSAAVYGDSWQEPIPSDAPLRPCSPYGAHKAAAEIIFSNYARCYGLSVAIVRLFSVYGPGLEKQLIWDLITRLEQSPAEISAAGTGKESRDFVFVSDAVAMLAESATHADSTAPVFNGGSGHSTTVRELVSHLIELWPAKTSLKFSGIARPGDPKALVADMSKSAAIRPRELTPLRKGLQLTIDAARLRQRAK